MTNISTHLRKNILNPLEVTDISKGVINIYKDLEKAAFELELEEVFQMMDNKATIEEIKSFVEEQIREDVVNDGKYAYRFSDIALLLDINIDIIYGEVKQDMADQYRQVMDFQNGLL